MIENQGQNRIFGLDLMRASAIIMVLCSHLLWIYPPKENILTDCLQLFGFLGVEVFFVLSGFLIGTIFYNLYMETNFSLKSVFYFLKRRWFRTLPNYYFVLLINIIIGWLIGYQMPMLWKYLLFQQNFHSTMLPFFPESWSLSIEEFAYLIIAFSVFIVALVWKSRNKKTAYIVVILFLILVFILSKIYYNQTTTNTSLTQWNVSLKSVVAYRIDTILIGVAFSWISLNFANFWKKYSYVLAITGAILFLTTFFCIRYLRILIGEYPLFWNVIYLPLTSVTIALFLPSLSQWKSTHLPFRKTIVFISLISYSLYLIHYGIVLQLMKHYIPTETLQAYQLHIFSFGFLFISFGLSYLNYRFFEKPITNLRDKK